MPCKVTHVLQFAAVDNTIIIFMRYFNLFYEIIVHFLVITRNSNICTLHVLKQYKPVYCKIICCLEAPLLWALLS